MNKILEHKKNMPSLYMPFIVYTNHKICIQTIFLAYFLM